FGHAARPEGQFFERGRVALGDPAEALVEHAGVALAYPRPGVPQLAPLATHRGIHGRVNPLDLGRDAHALAPCPTGLPCLYELDGRPGKGEGRSMDGLTPGRGSRGTRASP